MDALIQPPFARPSTNDPYLSALADRVLVYDGATGTNLQLQNLEANDFGGANFEGCNEILVVTKPEAIEQLHRSFLDVGVDVIETNSFGSSAAQIPTDNRHSTNNTVFILVLLAAELRSGMGSHHPGALTHSTPTKHFRYLSAAA